MTLEQTEYYLNNPEELKDKRVFSSVTEEYGVVSRVLLAERGEDRYDSIIIVWDNPSLNCRADEITLGRPRSCEDDELLGSWIFISGLKNSPIQLVTK